MDFTSAQIDSNSLRRALNCRSRSFWSHYLYNMPSRQVAAKATSELNKFGKLT